MARACNPNTLGGRGRWIMRSWDRDYPCQHGEMLFQLKIQKIIWAWWRVPVIPATQEAEAELPEPRRQRFRWAEIMPFHSSLGNKSETPSQKKKKNTKFSQVWWQVPVIPATLEAETGKSLEPRRRRLQWAEIVPVYSQPGQQRETLSQKKKTTKKKTTASEGQYRLKEASLDPESYRKHTV